MGILRASCGNPVTKICKKLYDSQCLPTFFGNGNSKVGENVRNSTIVVQKILKELQNQIVIPIA